MLLILDQLRVLNNVLGSIFALVAIAVVAFAFYLVRNVKIIEEGTCMVVERLGKFHRQLNSGMHFLVPFIDRPRKITWRVSETVFKGTRGVISVLDTSGDTVDLREAVMDFPRQPVITRDNVELRIHPMILYRIINPVRLAYEVVDPTFAVEKLVQTTLRAIIGDMGLDDTLASREEINRSLKQQMKNVLLNWGVDLVEVELLEILPSKAIQSAMHQQIAAERERRAAVISADGQRERLKTEAEGVSQAQIAVSKGEARTRVLKAKSVGEAKFMVAKAEAEAVAIIGEALQEFDMDAGHYMVGQKYLESMKQIALNAKERNVYFDYDDAVTGAAGMSMGVM